MQEMVGSADNLTEGGRKRYCHGKSLANVGKFKAMNSDEDCCFKSRSTILNNCVCFTSLKVSKLTFRALPLRLFALTKC